MALLAVLLLTGACLQLGAGLTVIRGAHGSCNCTAASTSLACSGLGIMSAGLPPSLSECANLTTVDLSNNQLTSLPAALFSSLPSLLALGLNQNNLTSLPAALFSSLTALQQLAVYANQLTSLPPTIFAKLKSLTQLNLSNNQLTGLPPTIFSPLTSLTQLTLSSNHLTGLPASLQYLSQLQRLGLHTNQISHVPIELSGFWKQRNGSLLFEMENNPSRCQYYYDAVNESLRFLCLCNSAGGFYGVDYCESVFDFVRLPVFLSQNISQTVQWREGDATFAARGSAYSQELVFSNASLSLSGHTRAVPLAIVRNSFSNAFRAASLQTLGYLGTALALRFSALPNNNVPTNFTFWVAASAGNTEYADGCLEGNDDGCTTDTDIAISNPASSIPPPSGLTLDASSGALSGTPNRTGLFNFTVWARETYSNESQPVAFVMLEVRDCGPGTCQNGGSCKPQSNPYDGDPDCQCASGWDGAFCTAQVDIEQTSSKSNTPVVLGIVLGIGAAALLVVVTDMIWLRRRRARLRKDYHIFISYRVDADRDLAEALCRKLQEHTVPMPKDMRIQVKVFWDAKDIRDGSNWKQTFLTALEHSCLFVPIVSETAIEPILRVQPHDAKADNVLLEYETAVRQQRDKLIAILPILVGRRNHVPGERIARFNFERCGGHMFPTTGSVTLPKVPVRETMTSIFANQGLFLSHMQVDGTLRCHPKIDRESEGSVSEGLTVADRIVQALEDTAWHNPSNPQAIPGRKHWRHTEAKAVRTQDGLTQQLLSEESV